MPQMREGENCKGFPHRRSQTHEEINERKNKPKRSKEGEEKEGHQEGRKEGWQEGRQELNSPIIAAKVISKYTLDGVHRYFN